VVGVVITKRLGPREKLVKSIQMSVLGDQLSDSGYLSLDTEERSLCPKRVAMT